MRTKSIFVIALMLLASFAVVAQEKQDDRTRNVYKLDFNVYELENGKRINERAYTLHVWDGERRGAGTRVGTRVPITTGDKGIQYMDVGLKIDATVQSADESGVTLFINFESSGFAIPEQGQTAQAGTPILRNISENVTAKAAYGKATLVSSVDDVNSKRRLQLEVTATRIK